MPGEAYRDPRATAEARIAQLEATAHDRGIPLDLTRRHPAPPFNWSVLGLLTAALVILFGLLEVRLARATADVGIDLPERRAADLGWFEPAASNPSVTRRGPIPAVVNGRRILVGLLWQRGRHPNGLHVATFDRGTLARIWIQPIPAEWISSDSDPRFDLRVDGDVVRLDDTTGRRYRFRLEDGEQLDEAKLSASSHPFLQAPVHESITDTYEGRKVSAYRSDNELYLSSGGWTTMIPDTARASRLRLVSQDEELIFVLVDDEMHVYKATSGLSSRPPGVSMSRDLQLAHERIQDLEALVAGRPLPVRSRPSPLRWLLFLASATALGFLLPVHRASLDPSPELMPPHALVLADDAPPVYVTAGGRDLALFRGWWRGREDAPLHVVALDCKDWSVRWISEGFPATAFDRGALRADNNGAAFLYTSTGPDQKRQFVLETNHGVELGSTDVPARWELEAAVREGPPEPKGVSTPDLEYTVMPGWLEHRIDDQVIYDASMPQIPAGSHFGSLTRVKNELVIVANDSIFIVDAPTGHLKQRIDSF